MKKIALALAAASIALSTGPAFAVKVIGVVLVNDGSKGLVLTEDGSEFIIPQVKKIAKFAPGTKVVIDYEDKDGEKEIKRIYKVK